MAFRFKRPLICLLTALLFAVSSVAHAYAVTDMLMKMPTAAMEASAPDQGMDDCGGGGDNKASHAAACVAMCATALAIITEPDAILSVVSMLDIQTNPEAPLSSLGLSPEPHPPKR